VGVIRGNAGYAGEFGEYDEFYGIGTSYAPGEFATSIKLGIVTRLMIDKEYRHTDLAFRLSTECFKAGLNQQIQYCFMDCNPPLQSLFERLGFVLIATKEHVEYGDVAVMKTGYD